MQAKLLLTVLALIFLAAAGFRCYRDGGRIAPASKAWFLTGGIFVLVSTWLWLR